MRTELLPDPARVETDPTDPQAVTEAFLHALADSDLDRAIGFLAEDAPSGIKGVVIRIRPRKHHNRKFHVSDPNC